MLESVVSAATGNIDMKSFKQLLKDTAGSLTPMLGLAAIPAFIAAGSAIDMVRINNEQGAFYAAIDAAALAIAADDRSAVSGLTGTALQTRMAELQVLSKKYIEANYDHTTGNTTTITSNLTITGSAIKLDASIEIPMTIMSLVGIQDYEFAASSTVKKAMRPIELTMVMDTTGSMASGGKLAGAKTAAHTLLTRLYAGSAATVPRSEFIRVSMVPFSGAVRLNKTHADFNIGWIDTMGLNPLSKLNFNAMTTPAVWNNYYAWSRVKSSTGLTAFYSWNGCVEGRQYGTTSTNNYLMNDAAPNIITPETLFPAYFNPDTPTASSGSYGANYITGTSTTAVGSECRGLTSTICSSTSAANLRIKQENYNKYETTNIGSSTPQAANCTASTVVPMTYNRDDVEVGIDAMVASGPTVIPEGLAWGWRVISPTQPFTQVQGSGSIPAASISVYNDVRWKKIMVLMTDGDNDVGPGYYGYNNTTYTAYGHGGEALTTNRYGTTSADSSMTTTIDTTMNTICSKIKAENVTLYVASFGSGVSTATRTRLQNCATTGVGYYTHAETSSDLTAFFDHIGEDVINKSVYVSN